MAGFDAGKAVDPLDFNFTTAPWWEHMLREHPEFASEGTGTIPDPTDGELEDFRGEFAGIFGVTVAQLATEGIDAAMSRFQTELESSTTEEQQAAQEDALSDLYACISKLCKGTPSAALIAKLPRRYFFAFLGWLFTELNPLAMMQAPATPTRNGLAARTGAGS